MRVQYGPKPYDTVDRKYAKPYWKHGPNGHHTILNEVWHGQTHTVLTAFVAGKSLHLSSFTRIIYMVLADLSLPKMRGHKHVTRICVAPFPSLLGSGSH